MSPKKAKSALFDFSTPPTRWELVLDLLAFVGTVTAALIQGWKAADVVWAAWLASLLTGLSFFLLLSAKMIIDKAGRKPNGPEERDENEELTEGSGASPEGKAQDEEQEAFGCGAVAVAGFFGLLAWLAGVSLARYVFLSLAILALLASIIVGLARRHWFGLDPARSGIRALTQVPMSLFMFGFFLAHFGGFHLGHAAFLGFLVPATVEVSVALDTIVSIREYLSAFFGVLIVAYWPYVASVAVKNFGIYRQALRNVNEGDTMILPYRNVIRIHLLIFALAPFAMADLGTVVAIIVLFFFFFPIEKVVAWYRSK